MMTRLKGPRLGTAIVIFAVALIPLLYAGLLTMTYQNPTNRLYTMTAAIVNEDQPYSGTLVTGTQETFSLGRELSDALVHPESGEDVGFTWKTMDRDEATRRLNDERVRAILYIPRDFSKNVAKIGTDIGSSATQELRLVTDDGVNYLAGTMAKTVSEAMTNRINERGATRITDRLLVSIEKVRTGVASAADGSATLADGTTKLTDGTKKFADGLGELSRGTGELSRGTGRLVVGMNDLANGTVTLSDGLTRLNAGAGRAADGSGKLSAGLTDLSAGIAKAKNGTADVKNGADQLAGGIHQLTAHAGQLGDGVTKLDQGAQQLLPGINAYTAGVDQAQAGSAKLAGAAAALPDALNNMSDGVGKPGDYTPTNPESATKSLTAGAEALNAGLNKLHSGVTQPNGTTPSLQQGATQLAGLTKLLTDSLSMIDTSDVQKLGAGAKDLLQTTNSYTESVDKLAQGCEPKTSETCVGLQKLAETSGKLRAGTKAVEQGAFSVTTKIQGFEPFTKIMAKLTEGTQGLKQGIDQVADGSAQLRDGSAKLTQSLAQASQGIGELKKKVGTASSAGDGTLLGGINDLNAGLTKISGTNAAQSEKLRAGTRALADGIGKMNGKLPELTAGVIKLDQGAGKLSAGMGELSSGMTALSDGANTAAGKSRELATGLGELKNGVETASNGANKLASGSQSAKDGVQALDQGARKLDAGAAEAATKAGELGGAATKLNDGAHKLHDGLAAGAHKIPQLTTPQQKNVAGTAGKVVHVQPVREHAVANNGAGFTPMFMSLALWVGTIALFLVLPALDHDERARGRWVRAVTRPAVTATLLAIVQAVIMMVVVNAMGELHAANLVGLSALAVLASICFMAINQACVAAFAFRGRFLSIVLLSLQITSMGATFPIETAPRFFQWIHWFLPMSDTQLAFRSLIAGGGVDGIVGKTVLVLVFWTVVSFTISLFASKVRIVRNSPRVHDEALAPTAG